MPTPNPNTTEKISQQITPKSSLLSNLIPFETRTPLTEIQAKRKNLPSTPKSKCRLGIDEDRKIIWSNPHFTPEDHSILTAYGKSQDTELDTLFARLIMTWFETNRTQVTTEADEFIKTENTTEDLIRIAEAARKKYERTIELLRSRHTTEENDKQNSSDPADTKTTEPTTETK